MFFVVVELNKVMERGEVEVEGGFILDRIVKKGFFKEMLFERRLEGYRGVILGNSKCYFMRWDRVWRV